MQLKSRGGLIFMEALFTVYAIITLGFAVMFEYYTVAVSQGNIIFSLGMSWQVILFTLELVTIIVQAVSIAFILAKGSEKAVKAVKYAGFTAGGMALACVAYLLATQGMALVPVAPFSLYALLICVVRIFIVNSMVKKYGNGPGRGN